MATSGQPYEPPQERPSSTYRLLSATFRDQTYPEGILWIDESRAEIELRQLIGKKRKQEVVVARFKVEANASVVADATVVRVSELSINLESPETAAKVADILQRPAKEREAQKLLSDTESIMAGFLETREEAMTLLSRIKTDPRGALVSVQSMWTAGDKDPAEAVYSAYSSKVAESLDKTKTAISTAEKTVGPVVAERLYALAYTVGAVQDALFRGGSLAPEVAALQELGVATTAQDLRMEKPSSRIMTRAHPVLVTLLESRQSSGAGSSSDAASQRKLA